MELPLAKDYKTEDEWLQVLVSVGISVGAMPMDNLGLRRITTQDADVAAFWDAIVGIGRFVPSIPGATIEEQLRASYKAQISLEQLGNG